MGNPLHFIQASDTSAFAALHTEQGALPSQYEALQAYLKKIGLGRFGTLWAEPVTGQATPAGYASISWYTPLEGVGTPLSRLDAGEAEQARAALRRAREAVTPISTTRPAASCSARRCSSLRRTMSSPSTAIPCSSTGACSRKARTKPRPRYSGASRKTGKRPPV